MRLEKRIRALETRKTPDPVVLYFEDGSTREICGRGDFLLDLLSHMTNDGSISPSHAGHLDLIRRAVSAREPGGGYMVELMQALMGRPAAAPSSVDPPSSPRGSGRWPEAEA
jgi:hypothetical protein